MANKPPLRLFNGLYIPITMVLSYLSTTMLLFEFGPIDYYTPDKPLLYIYLFYYLFALFLGYLAAMSFFIVRAEGRSGKMVSFWIILWLTVLGSLIENANIAKLPTLVPTNILTLISSGFDLDAAGASYYLSKTKGELYSSNRLLNIASFFFAWARPILIIYIGFNIHRLPKLHIMIGLSVSMIYPIGALSIGLNKPVMEFAILFLFSVIALLWIRKSEISPRLLKVVKAWSLIGVSLVLVAVWIFTKNMAARGVTIQFLEKTSPVRYITINCSLCSTHENEFLTGLIWLLNYVVQGYHGFSLALVQPFDSTLGFGNSAFLLRQFKLLTGTDLAPLTFQEKTDHMWGAYSHWHSIYTHFANDVHFLGVGIIMLALGWLFGVTWKLAVLQKNVYAFILIPIYAFMFIFFPANNQVFGFIPTLSAFVFANVMMFITFHKYRIFK